MTEDMSKGAGVGVGTVGEHCRDCREKNTGMSIMYYGNIIFLISIIEISDIGLLLLSL